MLPVPLTQAAPTGSEKVHPTLPPSSLVGEDEKVKLSVPAWKPVSGLPVTPSRYA